MKPITLFLFFLMFIAAASKNSYGSKISPSLKGPYFGQKPPGLEPEVFAPGIISINNRFEGAVSFSPELDEIYFGANDKDNKTAIYYSRIEGDKWTPIKRADFTKGKKDEEIHPFVSPSGERIYFTALNSDLSDTRIWYVNRYLNSWGDAVKLGSPINDEQVFFPNRAKNGCLYYFNLSKGKTYCANDKEGNRSSPKEVSVAMGHHAFISPTQDYLLVTARHKRSNGKSDNDIYVYFKSKDGGWGEAINLGKAVNSDFDEKNPSITPDGKYLFFGRAERKGKIGLANVYWVDTKVITLLRPKEKI